MNYYPFHLGDYASHTGHLEPMEDLAYRRLIDAYYLREGQLPVSVAEVARIVRLRDYQEVLQAVLNEFFELTDEGWFHGRCEKEVLRMQDKQAKAKLSAQASVEARKANAQRPFNERSTDVKLPTPTPTPTPTLITKDKTATRGARLPANWKPDSELAEWSKTERPDLDLRKVFAEFTDYWNSVAGGKGVKLDWNATWRNWVRSQKVEKQSFAQQSADVVRNTVAISPSYDSALRQIELDRKTAVPMPADIRAKINAVLRKA